MGIKKWNMIKIDKQKSAKLAASTGLDLFVCDILQARGMDTPEKLQEFFSEQIVDPFLLPDMAKAAERVQTAIDEQENICVYGDYDCDGITSTVLLYTYLQTMGAQVSYYIPDRDREGYGLNFSAIDALSQRGVNLIITVDNGISALEEIDYANSLGMQVVVTDHHKPRETLPNAVAVVDPHRTDCTAPFKNLAGVGVVFKLICAMEGGDGIELLDYYGDLTCIGTIADIVSLTGENRTIVRYGLERLQYTDNVGLRALLEISGLMDKRITCENVGFILAPRINAAGRMGITQKAVDLLLCEDEEEALELAALISEQNKVRQGIETEILKDISLEISKNPSILYERLLVLSGEGWHHGIIGIVCSKIMERYAKPCLLISVDGDEARGSGRSIEGFSLVDAIAKCSSHLTRYGGHTLAAGFSLDTANIEDFEEKLLLNAKEEFEFMPVMTVNIDREIAPQELTVQNLKKLSVLEPFGMDNETPVFAVLGAQIEAIYPIGSNGGHIRIRLQKDGHSFYAVYFGMTQERFPYVIGDTIDIAANCDVNVYNNEERVSAKIKTVRPTGVDEATLFDGVQQYERYKRNENWNESARVRNVPTRDDIAVIYRWLREHKGYSGDFEVLFYKLAPKQIGYCKLRLALDIMTEMGLITCKHTKAGVTIALCTVKGKVDLEQSKILQVL